MGAFAIDRSTDAVLKQVQGTNDLLGVVRKMLDRAKRRLNKWEMTSGVPDHSQVVSTVLTSQEKSIHDLVLQCHPLSRPQFVLENFGLLSVLA